MISVATCLNFVNIIINIIVVFKPNIPVLIIN